MTEPARATARPDAGHPFVRVWSTPPGILGWLREINNIPIATRYMATAFVFFLIGGVQALLLRIQLGTPENTFLDAQTYNQIFTMHGTTMMFLFVIPFLEALANYMVPLMLGTRDLPFPRLTALSYWTYVFGGLFLYSSFLFGLAPDGGWFAYVPLTSLTFSPGLSLDFWLLGLSVAEVAGIGAAAELIVAILKLRAPGMSLGSLPLFAWAMLITAVMIIFAFTPLIVVTTSAGIRPQAGDALLRLGGGRRSAALAAPLLGVRPSGGVHHAAASGGHRVAHRADLRAAPDRRVPRHGRLAMMTVALVSFGLWAHHMFTVGMSMVAMSFFAAASLLIAIPSGLQVFGWIATLWHGRAVWRPPLLFALGFIVHLRPRRVHRRDAGSAAVRRAGT